MGLILLEALGALVLLVLIVWWTMFSGRDKGELSESDDAAPPPAAAPAPPPATSPAPGDAARRDAD